jgi:hypothetical protein
MHMALIGKSAKKFRKLQMHSKNYENNPKFCKQKGTLCTQYLGRLHNFCDEDISARYVLQK